jgi:hypothetical protein
MPPPTPKLSEERLEVSRKILANSIYDGFSYLAYGIEINTLSSP